MEYFFSKVADQNQPRYLNKDSIEVVSLEDVFRNFKNNLLQNTSGRVLLKYETKLSLKFF